MRDIGSNLTNQQLINNLDEILIKSIQVGLKTIDITGTNLDNSIVAKNIAETYNKKYSEITLNYTVGFHPHNADLFVKTENNNLEKNFLNLINNKNCSMLGEIGLDYFRLISNRNNQIYAFEKQLDFFKNIKKPIFLHSRESFEDFMYIYLNSQNKNKKVIHSFTGNIKEAEILLENDFYFGINGWICDKKRNKNLIEALSIIPINKILIETDSPFLIPLNKKKAQRKDINFPYYIKYVFDKILEVKKIEENQLNSILIENEINFFNHKPNML